MQPPIKIQSGGVNLSSGEPVDMTERPEPTTFRLLIMGAFGGTVGNPHEPENRKPMFVDRDNFEELLAQMSPRLVLPHPQGKGSMEIAFAKMEDFEPDRLLARLPMFDELNALREQLASPRTFAQAAEEIQTWAKNLAPAPALGAGLPTPAEPAAAPSAEELLQEIMQRSGVPDPVAGNSEWNDFLRKIVQPNLVEKSDPRQADFEAVVDEARAALLRGLLHHPAFQTLEAAWRSLSLLVHRLETNEKLKIFAWDMSQEELAKDLMHDDLNQTLFYREVIHRSAGVGRAEPWALIVGLYTFGNALPDLEFFANVGQITAQAPSPFIATGSPRLVGCPSLLQEPEAREWSMDPVLGAVWPLIRDMGEARYLGLVVPRFLLRNPYGKEGSSIETFAFEELPTAAHEHFLWGSGAVLAALLLAENFTENGWSMDLDQHLEVKGLPVFVYDDDGDRAMKPCGEVALRDSAFETFVEAGLMVLESKRDRDGVRLTRFQSVAKGPLALAGGWSR